MHLSVCEHLSRKGLAVVLWTSRYNYILGSGSARLAVSCLSWLYLDPILDPIYKYKQTKSLNNLQVLWIAVEDSSCRTVTKNNRLFLYLATLPMHYHSCILMYSLYFKSWQASDTDRKDFMSRLNFEANTWVGETKLLFSNLSPSHL